MGKKFRALLAHRHRPTQADVELREQLQWSYRQYSRNGHGAEVAEILSLVGRGLTAQQALAAAWFESGIPGETRPTQWAAERGLPLVDVCRVVARADSVFPSEGHEMAGARRAHISGGLRHLATA